LYCAVDENDDYDADELCNLSAGDGVEPVDNADDVINELESLLEVRKLLFVFQEFLRTLLVSAFAPRLIRSLSTSLSVTSTHVASIV